MNVLIDPYGSTKITLWEGDIGKVEEGGTYEFKSLRLKKSKFKQELFVNPAKEDSAITKCAAFEKPLAVPENVPEEFTTTSIVEEVLGVSDIRLDYCRVKCNRCVKIQKIVTCDDNKCKLIQKLECCKKQWFLKALVGYDNQNTVNLSFRHDQIMQELVISDPTIDTRNLEIEGIHDAFLSLSDCKITYKNKVMVVTDISDGFY